MPRIHLQQHNEPVWRSAQRLAATVSSKVPACMQDWLHDKGSLTRRLVQACQGQFRVEVLSLAWQRPMLNEALRLGLPAQQRALIRQVMLYCNDQPWVYARTVLPVRTLDGPYRFLIRLGNRPLGAVLFADPSIKRDEMEFACIQPGSTMFDMATSRSADIPECIWGRRSVFHLQTAPILVNEIFLPSIPAAK